MSAKRIQARKARKEAQKGTLIELSPGTYMFTPYWATRKQASK